VKAKRQYSCCCCPVTRFYLYNATAFSPVPLCGAQAIAAHAGSITNELTKFTSLSSASCERKFRHRVDVNLEEQVLIRSLSFHFLAEKNTPLQLNLNKRAQASGTQQRHLNVWEDAQSARLHFSIFISRHSSTCQRRTEEHSNVILPVNCFQTPALERIKCASVSLGKVLADQAGSFLGMK